MLTSTTQENNEPHHPLLLNRIVEKSSQTLFKLFPNMHTAYSWPFVTDEQEGNYANSSIRDRNRWADFRNADTRQALGKIQFGRNITAYSLLVHLCATAIVMINPCVMLLWTTHVGVRIMSGFVWIHCSASPAVHERTVTTMAIQAVSARWPALAAGESL